MIIRRWFFLPLAIFVVVILAVFWPGAGRNWIQIQVVQGSTMRQVAQELKDKGMVKSVYPILFWTKLLGAGSKVKIGQYRFSEGRSAFWIVSDLTHGRTEKVRVPIPEGFSSWQIAERLQFLRVCEAEKFKEVAQEEELEGFLFPATYEMDVGVNPRTVAQMLRQAFDQHWTDDMEERAKELGWTQKETVTMASICEREVMDRTELPLVSAVYHNRLKRKMKLDADPTVQFALGYWKKRLLKSDIRRTDSPYNTYKYPGLPPGPICSPGQDALMAALWPADSNALYFVANEDGRHDFSTNYQDHINKVNRRNRRRQNK